MHFTIFLDVPPSIWLFLPHVISHWASPLVETQIFTRLDWPGLAGLDWIGLDW